MNRFRAGIGTTTRFIMALLGAAGVLTILLGYEAWQAERQHRSTVDRVMHEYAKTAAWMFVHRIGYAFTMVQHQFGPIAGMHLKHDSPLPGIDVMTATADSFARCADPKAEKERYYFILDWRTDKLTFEGPTPPPDIATLVSDTVRHRITTTMDEDWFLAPMFRITETGPRALLYVTVHDEHEKPLAVYGFETCNAALWEETFEKIFKDPLLPPALTGKLKNDSLLSIDVTAHGQFSGHYQSPIQYPATYRSEMVDEMETRGSMEVMVALRPDVAERLVLGGLPPSRVPMLVILLVLMAGVISVTVVLLRREQELVRLRANFTSSVSHELRTPLAEILLFSETMEMDRFPTAEARQVAVRIIAQEARHLTHIVDNVLQFSRFSMQRGRMTLALEPVHLPRALEEIAESFGPLAAGKGVELVIECRENLVIRAHNGAFGQVVLNLLDNALKYAPNGKQIIVRASRSDGMLHLEVEDGGPGIAPADRDRVWEPFVRLPAAEVHVTGSGIGLSVVRDLVQAHEGQTWVEAGAHGGTKVIVEWPLATTPAIVDEDHLRGSMK